MSLVLFQNLCVTFLYLNIYVYPMSQLRVVLDYLIFLYIPFNQKWLTCDSKMNLHTSVFELIFNDHIYVHVPRTSIEPLFLLLAVKSESHAMPPYIGSLN